MAHRRILPRKRVLIASSKPTNHSPISSRTFDSLSRCSISSNFLNHRWKYTLVRILHQVCPGAGNIAECHNQLRVQVDRTYRGANLWDAKLSSLVSLAEMKRAISGRETNLPALVFSAQIAVHFLESSGSSLRQEDHRVSRNLKRPIFENCIRKTTIENKTAQLSRLHNNLIENPHCFVAEIRNNVGADPIIFYVEGLAN